MPEVAEAVSAANNSESAEKAPSIEVYAVYGVEPEIQAYAMAKYSRSALSMKESLKEISQQKAEKFLNTFYFQYGHRSIADLAHISFAAVIHHARSADHFEIGDLRQLGQDVVLHAVGKERVLFVVAQIFQRQHRNAFLWR